MMMCSLINVCFNLTFSWVTILCCSQICSSVFLLAAPDEICKCSSTRSDSCFLISSSIPVGVSGSLCSDVEVIGGTYLRSACTRCLVFGERAI